MNVLLVYPEFPATFWSFKHALKFVGKKSSFPPLGLLTVAAMLPADWQLKLVDLNVRRLRRQDVEAADAVMISAMTVQQDSTEQVIKLAKSLGKTVIAGGPLFTCEPEKYPEVDHLILNEAELTLPPFLADFAAGRARRIYSDTSRFPEMEKTPVPRWDLVRVKDYASLSIQFSRGCPFNCDFCNVTALLGHRPRLKPVPQIIEELDAIYASGWRGSVFFVDDNFIGNKRVLKRELLPALIDWQRDKTGIPFYTEASINLSDDEDLMNMMAQSGFDTVFIGLETPSEQGLADCNKKQNVGRDLVACVHKIQRHGLQVQGGFIVGFDSDNESIFQRQIDFIQNSGIVMAMVGILQAPVGTALYERMKEEGRLLGNSLGNNTKAVSNFVTRMNPEKLREGYRNLFKGLYLPKPYYKRVKTLLRNYKAPVITEPLNYIKVRAFLRSCVRLGVLGRERYHYWKLLVWVMLRRRALLPLAVNLAITGHHFRKVYEQDAM
ncbi:B12-binding domain-containing radical SAM protein [Ruficoccus amylovorans]|uniref:B12-binding domain-containing radical SAM protein n=1 Tax=Ruficoccus amylovorans TaxID=1804625 RepID=A0A842HF08_9BACT|nr:B12-binding domain-containing radical SAM protein [Ruficoccus amylovorans]MBC2594157.1 B12-binding domain-containing radical SAM protein [Ruficoccus amylovorans]